MKDQRVVLKLLVLLFLVLWVTHFICCAFFGLGRFTDSDTGSTWLSRAGMDHDSFYAYSSAFHWSIAQLTLGACEIPPANSAERVFSIFMLLIGIVTSSTLTSSLSATMIKVGLRSKERQKHMGNLKRYLHQNKVDSRLAQRVEQQVRQRLSLKTHLADTDVPALDLMSTSLRQELHYATCERHINTHPVFRLWANVCTATAKTLCSASCRIVQLQSSDDLFIAGTMTAKAYYVIEGDLSYFQPERAATPTDVGAGSWLSEASLWMHWIHVGTTITETDCLCLTVDADGVTASLRHRGVKQLVSAYAKVFYKRTVQSVPPLAFPTDCTEPAADFHSIVVELPHEVRVLVGLDAIKQASSLTMLFNPWNLANLKEEVTRGQCIVLLTAAGELERVAPVMVIRIVGDDGSFLVQLAKWTNNQFVATSLLPGNKMLRGETKEMAVKRILKTKLGFMCDHVLVSHMESSRAKATSNKTKVSTTYLRTVCHTTLHKSFAWAKCDVIAPHLMESFPPPVAEGRRKVYLVKADGGSVVLYTWLREHQFEWLTTPAGMDSMQAWLSSLGLEDTVEICEGGMFAV